MVGSDLGFNSTITLRRSLGRRLCALREAAALKNTDLKTIGSRQKIIRLEDGTGPYKSPDIREFCRRCQVSADETEELVALAERAAEDRPWDDYQDLLPGTFGTFVDLEVAANRISMWQPDVMPGLLQTPDYARAVTQAAIPPMSDDMVERLVHVRSRRQAGVFNSRSNPTIVAVLNEAVVVRKVGSDKIRHDQLAHLRGLTSTGRVNIRILTFDSGAHAAMNGSFMLLEFPDPEEPTVAYVEGRAGARILTRQAHVTPHALVFESLLGQSVPLEDFNP